MSFASVQSVTIDRTNFKVGNSTIHETHIMNGFSDYNILTYAGFGYYSGGNVTFADTPDFDEIGSPLDGESIYPFGDVKFTQKCYDAKFNDGKDIKFYSICGHRQNNTYGAFIMDSYKSVNITIDAVPSDPFARVDSVSIDKSTVVVGDTVMMTCKITNTGGAGTIKWNAGAAYVIPQSNQIVFINGKSGNISIPSGETQQFSTAIMITQAMRDHEISKGVDIYLTGGH